MSERIPTVVMRDSKGNRVVVNANRAEEWRGRGFAPEGQKPVDAVDSQKHDMGEHGGKSYAEERDDRKKKGQAPPLIGGVQEEG